MTTMKKKILIADDAAFNRMMLKDILKRAGYEVEGEAPNGKAALDVYKQLHPDLTIMDITMPEMDGLQALKEILNCDADASVIMIAAADERTALVKCIEAGARGFIEKPFREADVAEALKKVIG